MKNLRRPTQDEIGTLIAMLAVIFGGWVRLAAPAIAGFPINDGGLFYVMMRAIQQNSFHLPAFVEYNGLNIPFTYPPLGLYVGALLSSLFHIDLLKIVQWLPATVLILTIPAFYLLSKTILESNFKAGIATLIFAFTPRSMTWPIMGGGVTRSFGYLILLLTLANVYLLFTKREKKYLLLSILFSTLTVLSHPEAALQTVGLCLLFWAFKGRDKVSTLNALYVGLGTLVLSAIWWIPALLRFGLDPFLAAAQTGSHSALAILYPIFAVLTDEPLMTFVAVLGVMGIFKKFVQRDYLLPAMYTWPFIADPRSSATYAMISLAMLAGVTISDVVLPALTDSEDESSISAFQNRSAFWFLLLLGFYLLGSTLYFGTQIAATSLTPANRSAFDWVKANTPTDSHFLVLTGDDQLFCDSVSEWFPALTDRISLTTIQGDEWLSDKKYSQAVSLQADLQACLKGTAPLDCIEQIRLNYDYLYISRQTPLKNLCRVVAPAMRAEGLIAALELNRQYLWVYGTDEVAIFAYQR